MKFSDILRGAEVDSRIGDAQVSGVQYDSRKVKPGDLFVAMHGETTDGNRYIDAAIKQGLIRTSGQTPAATMSAALYTKVKDEPRLVKVATPGRSRAARGSVRWSIRRGSTTT